MLHLTVSGVIYQFQSFQCHNCDCGNSISIIRPVKQIFVKFPVLKNIIIRSIKNRNSILESANIIKMNEKVSSSLPAFSYVTVVSFHSIPHHIRVVFLFITPFLKYYSN